MKLNISIIAFALFLKEAVTAVPLPATGELRPIEQGSPLGKRISLKGLFGGSEARPSSSTAEHSTAHTSPERPEGPLTSPERPGSDGTTQTSPARPTGDEASTSAAPSYHVIGVPISGGAGRGGRGALPFGLPLPDHPGPHVTGVPAIAGEGITPSRGPAKKVGTLKLGTSGYFEMQPLTPVEQAAWNRHQQKIAQNDARKSQASTSRPPGPS